MKRPGFTLVEVLLTVMIAALLVGSVVGATRGLAGARRKVDQRVERSMAARRGLETIVGALRNVRGDPQARYPVVVGTSGGGGGGNDKIDLLVMSDVRARTDGAESDQYEVSFYLTTRDGRRWPTLVCRKDPALDEHPDEGGMATVVADGIIALTFEYFAEDQWMSEWSREQTRTPKAVRVTIQAVSEIPGEPPNAPPDVTTMSTVVPLRAGKAGTQIRNEAPPEQPPEGAPK